MQQPKPIEQFTSSRQASNCRDAKSWSSGTQFQHQKHGTRHELETIAISRLPLIPGDYMILGEKPSPPYEIVALKMPMTMYQLGGSSRGFADGSEGSCVFWEISTSRHIAGEATIELHQRILHGKSSHIRNRQPDPMLLSANTVWDLRLDCLAQVLSWLKRPGLLRIEFRHGDRCVETYLNHVEGCQDYSTCFAGLNGPSESSWMGYVKESRLLIFQSFQSNQPAVADSEYWSTRTTSTAGQSPHPSLSTIELDAFACDYIERVAAAQSKAWSGHEKKPKLLKPFSTFYCPNNRVETGLTHLLYGSFECTTQSYYLFTLAINITRRDIRVKKCSRIGGQMGNSSRWKQLLQEPSDRLFKKAFMASRGNSITAKVVEGIARHSCEEGSCLKGRGRFPAPQALTTFSGISVKEINLPANRIKLVMTEGELVQEGVVEADDIS